MNLSLKINDITIEVSSELGVNSGLDIHLALQNDPTSSAANREKIILEISRKQTTPSTSDVAEEVFSEIIESEHPESPEKMSPEEMSPQDIHSDPLTTESMDPDSDEEIYYDALDHFSQTAESKDPDSDEEIYYDALDHFPPITESERPDGQEQIHSEETHTQITESERLESPEEIHSEVIQANHQLPQNAESHHQRASSEEYRSVHIANMRLEDGLFLLYDLTLSSTGIQRLTAFCFIPWRDILSEIIELHLPVDIKNDLFRLFLEMYKMVRNVDQLPEYHQGPVYRHLSSKMNLLFAWLSLLIGNQSPLVLHEVRQYILQTRRSVRFYSLHLPNRTWARHYTFLNIR